MSLVSLSFKSAINSVVSASQKLEKQIRKEERDIASRAIADWWKCLEKNQDKTAIIDGVAVVRLMERIINE